MVHGGDCCALSNSVLCKEVSNSAMENYGAGLPTAQEKFKVHI